MSKIRQALANLQKIEATLALVYPYVEMPDLATVVEWYEQAEPLIDKLRLQAWMANRLEVADALADLIGKQRPSDYEREAL